MPTHATLTDLRDTLRTEPNRPVRFRTAHYEVKPGYHLTEFKLARVASVDCGRGKHEWDEAIVELLDGSGDEEEFMPSGKVTAIVDDVVSAIPAASDADAVFEFGSRGLARYRIGSVAFDGDDWLVTLDPLQGQCKAASTPSCCKAVAATKPEPTSCCGDAGRC